MLWSYLPIDIGPCGHLLVCGRQTITRLHPHSQARLAKIAEEYFQPKCQHTVKGIIRNNFISRNCGSNWPALQFHNQLLARDGCFSSSL